MAGVTDKGFVAKEYDEIVSDLNTKLANIGLYANNRSDSTINNITAPIMLAIAEVWNAAEGLSGVTNIYEASGKWLDDLCASRLVYRKQGKAATGVAEATTTAPLVIPAENDWYTQDGSKFLNTTDMVFSLADSYKVVFEFPTTPNVGDVFSVTIGNVTYNVSYTTGTANTYINNLFAQAGFNDIVIAGNIATVTKVGGLGLTAISGFTATTYTTQTTLQYEKVGDFSFPVFSVVNYPSFSVIQSATNITAIGGGSYDETDDELRARYFDSLFSSGSRTASAIKAKLLSLTGVVGVNVIENDTNVYDAITDTDPHSIKVVVRGGDDTEIAQTIYDYKGEAIGTTGTTIEWITDSEGNQRRIQFQRVAGITVIANVTYSAYSEEELLTNATETIKGLVAEYINSLSAGQDVITGRIKAKLFSEVSGLEYITIRLGINNTLYPDERSVSISAIQEAVIALDGITVTKV